MSGHSKWAKIKRAKGASDTAKGNQFSKITKALAIAAKSGTDPETNAKLAAAIAQAKGLNMPKATIESAIRKGSGAEAGGAAYVEVTLEAVGKENVGLIIECATDNKNRTVSEIKKALERAGWTSAAAGAVSWQFESKGLVLMPVVEAREEKTDWRKEEETQKPIQKSELDEFELGMIEVPGVLNIERGDEFVEIETEPKAVGPVAKHISEKLGFKVESYEMIMIPKTPLTVAPELRAKVADMIELLEEHDDVQNVWSNLTPEA